MTLHISVFIFRKIHGQRNVFKGFFSNPIYYVIWISTFVSQVTLHTTSPKQK